MKSVVLKRATAPGLRRFTRCGFTHRGFRLQGFTLIELIVATAILVILTGLAVPLARVAIKREKERELRALCGNYGTPSIAIKTPPTARHSRLRWAVKAIRRISKPW